MRNLLLEKDKRAIRREYLVRLVIVTLSFIFSSTLLGIVFLLPSFFLSGAKARAIEEQHRIIEQSVAVREQEASIALLDETHTILMLLRPPPTQTTLLDLVGSVEAARPDGVAIREFFWNTHPDRGNTLALSGVAETRDVLLLFERRLKDDPTFDSVTLPISNLAADRDLSFSVTLSGSF